MIYEVKQRDKTFQVDDLKPFDQQTKAFQIAFNEVEKQTGISVIIALFDNADAILYTESTRVLIILKEASR